LGLSGKIPPSKIPSNRHCGVAKMLYTAKTNLQRNIDAGNALFLRLFKKAVSLASQ
jgi:hypothetical protein